MKKIWICNYIKNVNGEWVENETPICVFSSRRKAEAYCKWMNKDNDQDSNAWLQCQSYIICEEDFDKVPF